MIIHLKKNIRLDVTLPIGPVSGFTSSALPLEFVDIPGEICGAAVVAVAVTVTNADGVAATAPCEHADGVWRVIFAASCFEHYGYVESGVSVALTLRDGSGNERRMVLAVGDLEVKRSSPSAAPGDPEKSYQIKGEDIFVKTRVIDDVQHYARQEMSYDAEMGAWGADWLGDYILVDGEFVPFQAAGGTAATVATALLALLLVPFSAFGITATKEYVDRKDGEIAALSTNIVTTATNDVLDAARGYTDTAIAQIPEPDFSTNNAALVETIEATAPAPGNYAAVSNAAVYAAITNTQQDAAIESNRVNIASNIASLSSLVSLSSRSSTNYVDVTLGDWESNLGIQKNASWNNWKVEWAHVSDESDYATLASRLLYNGDEYDVDGILGAVDDKLSDYVPTSRTINNYSLFDDITLSGADILVSDGSDELSANDIASSLRNDVDYLMSEAVEWVKADDLAASSASSTNYTDAATNLLAVALRGEIAAAEPGNYETVSNKAMTALQSYTESDPTISAWAKAQSKPTYTASEVGATTAADVYRLVAGTNVVLVVTNYNSATHAAAMKLQHLDPESGQYVTYWDEMRQHEITYTKGTNYTDAAIAERAAPRAWSGTTSGLGSEAPAGVTWISTPETVIAGGFEYEKVVTSAGAVWVLTSNGMSTGATSNSFFRVAASDGTELFSIEKTDSYLIGVNADGITRSGNTVTIPINVVAAEHPYIRCTKNLVNPTWVKEDGEGLDCAWATVSWSGTTGAYVATVTTAEPQAFFYFEYMVEGQVKIKNSAKTEMSGGILFNGTTYLPTVNGNKLEFVAQ